MADEQQSDDKILLKEVRLSFPNLFEPKAGKSGDKARYSSSFLLDKTAHADQITLLKRAIYALAIAEWEDKTKQMFEKGKITPCLHEGEDKEEWAGYDATNMYLSTSSDTRPHCVDRDQSPLQKDDGKPYAGCYVNAAIRLWVQNNTFGQRVNCELLGVQFVRDGEAFGKPPFKPDEFFPKLDERKEAGGKKRAAAGLDDGEIPF